MQKLIHNILGTPYTMMFGKKKDLKMNSEHMGLCRIYAKEILVYTGQDDCTEKEREVRVQETVAHEIFHAYLNEAGVDLDADVEEALASFYMKNWRKMNNSVLTVLDEIGFLDK